MLHTDSNSNELILSDNTNAMAWGSLVMIRLECESSGSRSGGFRVLHYEFPLERCSVLRCGEFLQRAEYYHSK
jgi:hypothetical protein